MDEFAMCSSSKGMQQLQRLQDQKFFITNMQLLGRNFVRGTTPTS
jgi:hypothetical protein